MLLLQIDPGQPAAEQAGRGHDRLVGADAERALRMRMAHEMGKHIGEREQSEDEPDRSLFQIPSPLGPLQPVQVSSSLVAKILLRSVPAGSLKKASVRLAWFC